MFGFTYDTWREICEMYFKLGDGSKKAYLQWFPFSKKLLFCKWVVIIRLFTMFRAHCISISHSFWRQNCHFYKF